MVTAGFQLRSPAGTTRGGGGGVQEDGQPAPLHPPACALLPHPLPPSPHSPPRTITPEPCGPGTLLMSLEKTIQAAFGRSPGAAQVAQKGWRPGSTRPLSA